MQILPMFTLPSSPISSTTRYGRFPS